MHRRIARALAPIAALAAIATVLVACGGGGDDTDSSGAQSLASDPATALSEIPKTQAGLAQALKLYKSGDDKGAASAASDTYLDHFEYVEGPLREQDEDLMLSIETAIRTNLILSMQDGQSVDAVSHQIDEINDDLATAKTALQGAQ